MSVVAIDLGRSVRASYHQSIGATGCGLSNVLVHFHLVMALVIDMIQINKSLWNEKAPLFVSWARASSRDAIEMIGAHSLGDLTLMQETTAAIHPTVIDATWNDIAVELQQVIVDFVEWWTRQITDVGSRLERLLAALGSAIDAFSSQCDYHCFGLILGFVNGCLEGRAQKKMEFARCPHHPCYQAGATGQSEGALDTMSIGSWSLGDE